MDNSGGWAKAVLGSTEGAEHDTDWKASLARCAWSILYAALYHTLGSVLASRPYGIVAIWFWMPNLRLRWNFTTSIEKDKREVSCDKQVERGGDSSQLRAKGFVGRRRKWGYQKEIKRKSAAYL